MIKNIVTIQHYTITIFSPEEAAAQPIVYTHFSADAAEAVAQLLAPIPVTLVAIDGIDWNRQLSPWPATRAFRGEEDFAGEATLYLKELTENILPAVEKTLLIPPTYRAISGYSMAGLFAVYALYHTDLFAQAASISGSLWYDDFADFLKTNQPVKVPERIYFSLGDRESAVRNQRLARVGSCTTEAAQIMQELGVKTIFEWNPGNHFAEVPERMAKGIRWICQ